jgi:hypothetical protein
MPAPVTASPLQALDHWQNLCPACKRRTVAFAQLRIKEAARV